LSKISILFSLVLIILLATAFLIPCSAAQAAASDPLCWGVFIGVSDYQNLSPFIGADNDAQELSQALSPTWGTEHVKVLLNSAATKSSILNAIDWLATKAQPNDTVLFCFSGRGAEDGYCVPYDSLADSFAHDISTIELEDAFQSVKAKNSVIILQTYEAGLFQTDLNANGRVILMSSRSNEPGYPSTILNHGVFMNFVIEAFSNFDDTDNNHDYELSAEEIFYYAGPATTQWEVNEWGYPYVQHPIMDDRYSGELPLLSKFSFTTTLPASSGTVATLDGVNYTSSISPLLWVPNGSHTLSVPEVVSGGEGKRYVFTGWNDGETSSSRVVSHGAYTANYRTEFLLTITSPFGDPTGAGWYTSGFNTSISITNYVETSDTRYYFIGWSGDFSGNVSSGTITMNSPKSLTGNWRTEYLLTLNSQYGAPTGAGWYQEGTIANISVEPIQGIIIRRIFDGWSGAITATDANTSVGMNEPKIITANWHTDYIQLIILIIVAAVIAFAGAVVTIMLVRRKGGTTGVPPAAVTPTDTPPPPDPPEPPPTLH
jgi:hypothetical protein